MCFVSLDLRVPVSFAIVVSNFKPFFLTDVGNYCEERKIKVLIKVYLKVSAKKIESNFLNFWQFF